MAKYEVIRPWFGSKEPLKVGDIVELKEVHPSIKGNVRRVSDKLVPATPKAAAGGKKGDENDPAKKPE